jgi:hypothetical protein
MWRQFHCFPFGPYLGYGEVQIVPMPPLGIEAEGYESRRMEVNTGLGMKIALYFCIVNM